MKQERDGAVEMGALQTQYPIYFVIGLLAGLMSGIFGIGGGSIRIPLLNLAGLPLISAFGINLLVIPFSSLAGALSHRKNIAWEIAPHVVVGGILGSVTGAFLTGLIPYVSLALIFVAVSSTTVLGIYLDRMSPRLASKAEPRAKIITPGAFFLNLLTGMRGGSGGSLFPPFLRMLKINIHRAIATSLFATIFTAVAGVIIYWYRGDILLLPAVVVIIGSVTGARLGSVISLKTKPEWLEMGLSVFVIALALIVVLKAF